MHYWYCPLPAILNHKTKNACGCLDLDICGWSEAPAPSEIMAPRGWDTPEPGPGRSKKTLTGRTQSATRVAQNQTRATKYEKAENF